MWVTSMSCSGIRWPITVPWRASTTRRMRATRIYARWTRWLRGCRSTARCWSWRAAPGSGQGSLATRGHRVTAVDAAPEMLAVARDRVGDLGVEFVQADLFAWNAPRRFDTVFFAFWLSHVPPARFAAFWELVRRALRPGGRACFVDDGPGEEAVEEVLTGQPAPAVRRQLNDGSVHRIVKVFPQPEQLARGLTSIGWSARVWPIGAKLIAGVASPPQGAETPVSFN